MRSGALSASVAQRALVVALVGLGVLMFGGLLVYYGDNNADEYLWKGPVAAVVILTVCVAALVALQHPALPEWMRLVGYVVLVLLGSGLAFFASVTYLEERCDDPGYTGQCGLPILGAMLWGIGAAVCVAGMAGTAEYLRQRRRRHGPASTS